MPKKKKRPSEKPKSQHERFKDMALELGADTSGKAFRKAFKKIVPPKSSKSAKSNP
jgi:hypothetical protein